MNISDALKAGLETYTERKVQSIKVHPDPQVSETWAARAVMADDGQQIDFFVVGSKMKHRIEWSDSEAVANNIEECLFDRWPPAPGPLRFF